MSGTESKSESQLADLLHHLVMDGNAAAAAAPISSNHDNINKQSTSVSVGIQTDVSSTKSTQQQQIGSSLAQPLEVEPDVNPLPSASNNNQNINSQPAETFSIKETSHTSTQPFSGPFTFNYDDYRQQQQQLHRYPELKEEIKSLQNKMDENDEEMALIEGRIAHFQEKLGDLEFSGDDSEENAEQQALIKGRIAHLEEKLGDAELQGDDLYSEMQKLQQERTSLKAILQVQDSDADEDDFDSGGDTD